MAVDRSDEGAAGRPGLLRRTSDRPTTERRITHIDPWAMLRFSLIFALCLWLMLVIAGVFLWVVAAITGTLHNVEDFLAQLLAESSFSLDGVKILLGSAFAAIVLLGTAAVFSAITSVLFNLSAGLIGGLRVTVVEFEDEPADTSSGSSSTESA